MHFGMIEGTQLQAELIEMNNSALLFRGKFFPQIWSACLCEFFRHFTAPFCNFFVVAGLQNFRDGATVPFGWLGVLWVFEEAVGKTFLNGAIRIS